ncbi:mannitol dehydrogenase family protein, partial [Pseudomonas syringae pv. tagetis]
MPAYTGDNSRQGLAHIGVGGFPRAHQACYTDALMISGEGFECCICGVGMRPEDNCVRVALAEQDYLYTLYVLGDS